VLSADQKSNPHSDAANHDADYMDNNMSEEDKDEDRDKDTTEYGPHAMDPDPRLNRGETHFHLQTCVP
jgi:hypothetical protein